MTEQERSAKALRMVEETRQTFRRMMREFHPDADRLERNENIVAYFLRKFRKDKSL